MIKSFYYYQVTTSPDNYNELEVLVPGVVSGARVEKPLGKGTPSAF